MDDMCKQTAEMVKALEGTTLGKGVGKKDRVVPQVVFTWWIW